MIFYYVTTIICLGVFPVFHMAISIALSDRTSSCCVASNDTFKSKMLCYSLPLSLSLIIYRAKKVALLGSQRRPRIPHRPLPPPPPKQTPRHRILRSPQSKRPSRRTPRPTPRVQRQAGMGTPLRLSRNRIGRVSRRPRAVSQVEFGPRRSMAELLGIRGAVAVEFTRRGLRVARGGSEGCCGKNARGGVVEVAEKEGVIAWVDDEWE